MSNRKGKRSWRYFTSKQVEKSRVRREIESIPFEERNNVEATIFLIRLNLIGNIKRIAENYWYKQNRWGK